jgi:hypothetical protein
MKLFCKAKGEFPKGFLLLLEAICLLTGCPERLRPEGMKMVWLTMENKFNAYSFGK